MIITDDSNIKIHADFLPESPQFDRREVDSLRITVFTNVLGEWTTEQITISSDDAKSLALAIFGHYENQSTNVVRSESVQDEAPQKAKS